MKISLSIIREELSESVISYNYSIDPDIMNLSAILFFDPNCTINLDTVYILTSKLLDENIECFRNATFICIGKSKHNISKMNYIEVAEESDIFLLSNTVHSILDRFQKWDFQLQHSTEEFNILQYIVDISEPIFHNGFSVMSPDYHLIAETHLNATANGYSRMSGDQNSIPLDQVNAFKNDKRYREITNEREIFLYPNEVLPYQCLCKNIFHDDKFAFRVILSDTNQPFREYDKGLLAHMLEYVEHFTNPNIFISKKDSSELTAILLDIIRGNSYDKSVFNREISRLGWEISGTYLIMHIQLSENDLYTTTMTFFCQRIMHEFRQTYAFVDGSCIIVIINIDKIAKPLNEYFSEFNYFVREGNFRVGSSNYFDSLDNIKEYALEARLALEIGIQKDPTKWSHAFSDCLFEYLLQKITSELPCASLCSPVIIRLQKHDQENQTDYVNTLKMYLHNNMNAVQTAKDLFIHRATMVYRLGRIKEIGKTELNNPDELLHIQITFRLLIEE